MAPEAAAERESWKLAVVVPAEVQLSPGKLAAQVAHAAVDAALALTPADRQRWLADGQPKVVLRARTPQELQDVIERATARRLPVTEIADAGRTEVAPGTRTAVGIGPAAAGQVDGVTGALPLC